LAPKVTVSRNSEFAQRPVQPENLGTLQRPRRAARLHGQRMRPFAGEQAHHLHEACARRQHLVRRVAQRGAKAFDCGAMPAAAGVVVTGEVGHEEQVEMRQMVGQVFGRQRQVGGQPAVVRRLDVQRIGQREGGGGRLGDRADAADARHQYQRIGRQLALQDLFKAAVQRRIDIGRDDLSVGDVEADFKVAFDAVEGADDASRVHRALISWSA